LFYGFTPLRARPTGEALCGIYAGPGRCRADLGITPEVREDHAAYLGHWLTILKEDKRDTRSCGIQPAYGSLIDCRRLLPGSRPNRCSLRIRATQPYRQGEGLAR
jgi:hypothetical protein